MLRQKFVDMYARGSRVDLLVAERDVVLTYVLKILSEHDILNFIILKGGTCLRKMYLGRTGRFSEDLDFTATLKISPKDIEKKLRRVFVNKTYYDIKFDVEDSYETEQSCGFVMNYSHEWNKNAHFEIEISLREMPILKTCILTPVKESYMKYLEFSLFSIPVMSKEEIISEKIRASYQRRIVRDIYDLYLITRIPYNKEIVRKVAVIKFWNVHDPFIPEKFFKNIMYEKYDWDDLQRLVRADVRISKKDIIKNVVKHFQFLSRLSDAEKRIIKDSRRHGLEKVVSELEKELSA